MKKAKMIIRIGCVLLLIAGGLWGTYKLFLNPYRGTVTDFTRTAEVSNILTRDEAVADIDYMLKLLKERHPACMDGLPEAVSEQVRIEKDGMPDQVTVLRLWQGSARILAKMNDTHTNVNINMEINECLPISFRFEKGRLYCADGEYADNAVISIGGIPVEDLLHTFKDQFSYEQDGYAEYRFARLCRWKDDLAFMNVDISAPVVIVFETPSGEVPETYSFEVWKPEQGAQDTPFVTYEIDKDNGVGIFTLTECHYNDIYRETLSKFFIDVKNNQIQTVVVDLTDNSGGNSLVANEFIRYLPVNKYFPFGRVDIRFGPVLWKNQKAAIGNTMFEDLLFHGDIYVLTSPRTFSSATNFAVMLYDNGLGKIVGETSGGMPSSYGDVLSFQFPHSKLMYNMSYKHFHRPDESKDDLPLVPDYPSAASDALDKVYQLMEYRRSHT